MACFCVGGPNCCVNWKARLDWTTVGPLVTSGSSTFEITPPDPCFEGHDFDPVPAPGDFTDRVYCRRCAETRAI